MNDWRIRDDGIQELRLGSPAPPSSTCPATAAGSSDASPVESPTERQERNLVIASPPWRRSAAAQYFTDEDY